MSDEFTWPEECVSDDPREDSEIGRLTKEAYERGFSAGKIEGYEESLKLLKDLRESIVKPNE